MNDLEVRIEQLEAENARLLEERDTKQGRMIHAWGYDKAKEYVGVLLS